MAQTKPPQPQQKGNDMMIETQPDAAGFDSAAWKAEVAECYESSARYWRDISAASQRAGNHNIVIIAHAHALQCENLAGLYRRKAKEAK